MHQSFYAKFQNEKGPRFLFLRRVINLFLKSYGIIYLPGIISENGGPSRFNMKLKLGPIIECWRQFLFLLVSSEFSFSSVK